METLRGGKDPVHQGLRDASIDEVAEADTAKRFVTTAEDALRTKNLVLARSVADKAATLAAQLAGK